MVNFDELKNTAIFSDCTIFVVCDHRSDLRGRLEYCEICEIPVTILHKAC